MNNIEKFMLGLTKNVKTQGYAIEGEFKLWLEPNSSKPVTVYVQWSGYTETPLKYTVTMDGEISTLII